MQPANGSILFRGMIPVVGAGAYPTAAQTAAQEDLGGTTENWSMTAYAICGTPFSALQVVDSSSDYNSTASKNHGVECPAGTRVVGAGGTISGANGRVKIDEIRPNESLTQVDVYASEDQDATTRSWEIQAYAVCASPPAGLVRVTAERLTGWNGRAVTATCPAGKKLLSAAGGTDAFTRTNLRVYSILPAPDLTSATVRATSKGSASGVTGYVRAYAICADG